MDLQDKATTGGDALSGDGMIPGANATVTIIDTDTMSFEKDVIEASMHKPVIVDFWAPWCTPCKNLMPILEKIVREAGGAVALVKVNIDENQELAQAMRIQSVPMVFAFHQGQPVDGFPGAKSESEVRAFVKKMIGLSGQPAPDMQSEKIEMFLEEIGRVMEEGDFAKAYGGYAQVLELEPENLAAQAGMARCLVELGETDAAREVLDALPQSVANDPNVLAAQAALELAGQADDVDLSSLYATLENNPDDHEARFELANALFAAKKHEEAIDELIEIVRRKRDWNEEAARKQLLKFFDSLGQTHELTVDGRRKLSAVLFS